MSLRSIPECLHAFGNAATATIAVVPATPGRKVAVYRMILTNAAAAGVTVQDTGANALSQQFQLPASNMPMVMETQNNGDPWFSTTAGVGIQLAQSGTVTIGFDMWYQLTL